MQWRLQIVTWNQSPVRVRCTASRPLQAWTLRGTQARAPSGSHRDEGTGKDQHSLSACSGLRTMLVMSHLTPDLKIKDEQHLRISGAETYSTWRGQGRDPREADAGWASEKRLQVLRKRRRPAAEPLRNIA